MHHSIRTPALAALFLLSAAAAPATLPATTAPAGPALSWTEAAKHVGEKVTLTGPVMGTHVVGKSVVLNIGKDHPAPDRFTIMMPFDDAAGSADDQFIGKIATVTGKVKLYKEVPEITTKKAADVTLKADPAAPTTAPAAPAGPMDR